MLSTGVFDTLLDELKVKFPGEMQVIDAMIQAIQPKENELMRLEQEVEEEQKAIDQNRS
jgi:hypothetical protein